MREYPFSHSFNIKFKMQKINKENNKYLLENHLNGLSVITRINPILLTYLNWRAPIITMVLYTPMCFFRIKILSIKTKLLKSSIKTGDLFEQRIVLRAVKVSI